MRHARKIMITNRKKGYKAAKSDEERLRIQKSLETLSHASIDDVMSVLCGSATEIPNNAHQAATLLRTNAAVGSCIKQMQKVLKKVESAKVDLQVPTIAELLQKEMEMEMGEEKDDNDNEEASSENASDSVDDEGEPARKKTKRPTLKPGILQKKPNRLGQRARKELAHGKLPAQLVGRLLGRKRGRATDNATANADINTNPLNTHETAAKGADPSRLTLGDEAADKSNPNRLPLGKPNVLHPSWEAKRKQKEQEAQGFVGKKITF